MAKRVSWDTLEELLGRHKMSDEEAIELQEQIEEMSDEDLAWLITICMEEKEKRKH